MTTYMYYNLNRNNLQYWGTDLNSSKNLVGTHSYVIHGKLLLGIPL